MKFLINNRLRGPLTRPFFAHTRLSGTLRTLNLDEGIGVRRSKKGGSVYTRIGVWRGPKGEIHMTLEGVKRGHVVVRPEGEKTTGHPSLFACLERLLNETGPGVQRPRSIQIQYVAQDGTTTPGPMFKLPSSI